MVTKQTISKHYNQVYFQKRDSLPLSTAIMIKTYLKSLKIKKILEVGCGTGQLVNYLKNHGFQTEGVDQSKIACLISHQKQALADKLPYKKNTFDTVLAISLIEHLNLQEMEKFLFQSHHILKKNGIIFLITPNYLSPNRFLKGKNWFAYLDPTHLNYYHLFTLKKLLKKNGFTNFQWRFPVPKKPVFACPFFNLADKRLPLLITDLITYLFFSTPLAFFRDSLWLSAQKY